MNKKIFVVALTLLLVISSVCCVEKSMAKAKTECQKLVDCLKLTKDVDSLEVDSNSLIIAGDEQLVDLKMNLKIENIKSNLKGILTFDVFGDKMEFYLRFENNEVKIYSKEDSGEYSVIEMDAAEFGEMNITRTFDAYIEIVESNPELVSKINDNTYQMNIPQNQMLDCYQKITGKQMSATFDSLIIKFVIGADGYLQNFKINAKVEAKNLEMNAKYLNHNKKFGIVLPEV